MKTHPIYLENSYVKEIDSQILEVQPEGDNRWRVVLEKTVFYPMGGGQPTDQGTLKASEWEGKVYQVMMKDGEIWHYVEATQAPSIGTTVHGVINWDRRFQNMRVHSAGHVVDFAMYMLGYSPNQLKPLKGDHGKKPHIVYGGVLNKDIAQELEQKANEIVDKGMEFACEFVPLSDLEKDAIYLQPGLPTNKPLRKLTLVGVGSVADGGTQVKIASEVGKITIPSVEEKEGNTIVNYAVV